MATPPDALLVMGRQCPYCPTVLKHLQALHEEGVISALETVVLEDHPDRAAELGVRSVPWIRIGSFELTGLRSKQELQDWAEKAATAGGRVDYLAELLSAGGIDTCLALVRGDPGTLTDLLQLFTDPDTELNVQIGISAIMESLHGSRQLATISQSLRGLLESDEPRVRGDACYFLSLTEQPEAADWIRPLLDDTDANVREIAADSLRELEAR